MVWAYILTDNKANEYTGFEGFCRDVKPEVGPEGYYLFGGSEQLSSFIKLVKGEIHSGRIRDRLIELVLPKVREDLREAQKQEVLRKWDSLDMIFDVFIYPENKKVVPHVPVVQYAGPRWIGQLLETPILNIINGATGLNTQKHFDKGNLDKLTMLEAIVFPEDNSDDLYMGHHIAFQTELGKRAREYRSATKSILLEAGLRRAPSFNTSLFASGEALHKGWDGTSNVACIDILGTDPSNVGGTMAHAFVMSFETELESFKAWDKIFPGSTILIDTYDVVNAANMLVEHNIKPNDVRIDSDPLDGYAFQVREVFNKAGWGDVGIFLSGDLTPETLRDYESRGVPFTKCMAGSKYLNNGYGRFCNCGFVYKIVEYEDSSGKMIYPQKKSTGKKSYPGLKGFRPSLTSNEVRVVVEPRLFDRVDTLGGSVDNDTVFVIVEGVE